MRILANIPHPKYRIVAYALDSHFYIENKANNLEEIKKWLDSSFFEEVQSHFEKMYLSHKDSMDRNL